MPGTEIECGATFLRTCDAMSSAEIGYGPTRVLCALRVWCYLPTRVLSDTNAAYDATQIPVLSDRMVLRQRCVGSRTATAY
eukprot:346227-Rhodomonas_salina.2